MPLNLSTVETEAGSATGARVNSVATLVVGGVTYVIAPKTGGGLVVYSVNADGTLTQASTFDDTASAYMANVTGVAAQTYNGVNYVYAVGSQENGFTVLTMDADGQLTFSTAATTSTSPLFAGLQDVVITNDQWARPFAVGDSLGAVLRNQADNTWFATPGFQTIDGVIDVASVKIGVTSYTVFASPTDNALQAIATFNAMQYGGAVADNGTLHLSGVRAVELIVFAGSALVFAGGTEGAIDLFYVGGNGSLNYLQSLSSAAFDTIGAITAFSRDGVTYVAVATLDSIELYSLDGPNVFMATLTHVTSFDTSALGAVTTMELVTSGGNSYLLVDGAFGLTSLAFEVTAGPTGTAGPDDLDGTTGDDAIDGGAGNDTLNGGDGADTLNGGDDDDVLNGEDGADILDGGDGADELNGGAGVDDLTGGAGDDSLNGGDGDDVLYGNDGADLLGGGTGVDTMYGGTGDDTYIVMQDGDIVDETGGDGIDLVRASISYTLTADVENLVLMYSQAINGTGNDLANVITGNAANNVLSGLAGNDILNGGSGADTLNGGTGSDTLNGDAGNDILNGGDDSDTLNGGAGLDVLDGGAGDDIMAGGASNDTYYADSQNDLVTELADGGTDTVIASSSFALGANVENLTLTGSAHNAAQGTEAANVINGNGGNNYIAALGGADTIDGGGGDDWILAGQGNDTLTGGAGADTFAWSTNDIGAKVETDRILDLSFAGDGDVIDLTSIDANSVLGGDQAFVWVTKFSKAAGEALMTYSGGVTTVSFDINGDGKADFKLELVGDHTGTKGNLYTGAGDTDGGWVL